MEMLGLFVETDTDGKVNVSVCLLDEHGRPAGFLAGGMGNDVPLAFAALAVGLARDDRVTSREPLVTAEQLGE